MLKTSSQACGRCKHRFGCLLDKHHMFTNLVQFFMHQDNKTTILQTHSGTYIEISMINYGFTGRIRECFPWSYYEPISRKCADLNMKRWKFRHRCNYIGRRFSSGSAVWKALSGRPCLLQNEPMDLVLCYIKFISGITEHPICPTDGDLEDVIQKLTDIKWQDYFVLAK